MLGPGASTSQPPQPLQPIFSDPRPPSARPGLDPSSSPPQPPLIFTQQSPQYQSFFPHSPHRVFHDSLFYPTATHLHEALKYLPNHPTIASQIRLSPSLSSVYPLSAANTAYVRPDWGEIFVQEMEKVLELKFRQHPELRDLLVEGVVGRKGREVIYRDEKDAFWGDGGGEGRGANELGKCLRRVRDRLIDERDRGLG
ncbi:hypothetical protein EV360DRAFT_53806 [Lentinula raphanica]|nr:hypothetical protein EV360DRAFT_53806 [Lentinula raphanica]